MLKIPQFMAMLRTIIILVAMFSLMACGQLDDLAIPVDAARDITLQALKIDPARNYLNVQIVNSSPYTMTSCQLSIQLFQLSDDPDHVSVLSPFEPQKQGQQQAASLLKKNFLIRQDLAPGYSTEVYYELKMDQLRGTIGYTLEITQPKGRKVAP